MEDACEQGCSQDHQHQDISHQASGQVRAGCKWLRLHMSGVWVGGRCCTVDSVKHVLHKQAAVFESDATGVGTNEDTCVEHFNGDMKQDGKCFCSISGLAMPFGHATWP